MNDKAAIAMKDAPLGTLAVLHPAVEPVEASRAHVDLARAKAKAASPAHPGLAQRLQSLRGKRLALFGNGKVNAFEILAAVGKRLEAKHGIAETKFWYKPHAAEAGTAYLPGLLAWKPDLVLTALGD